MEVITRLAPGWSGTAGDMLATSWGRAAYAREGLAGSGLAAGWRLAGSRHFPAMNWLRWLAAFRLRDGSDAAGG